MQNIGGFLMLPIKVNCPKCKTELSLEENERKLERFRCPSCMSFIDHSGELPKIIKPDDYVKFKTTINQGEIALIKSIFDSEEIDYYISGDNFLSMDPLIQGAKVFVIKSDLEKATALLRVSNTEIIKNNQRHNN
jgi:Zn-finger nucleic acid-binding protein